MSLSSVINTCVQLLASDVALETRQYLDSRLNPEFQRKFQFGWFPSQDHLAMLAACVPIDDLKELGVVYSSFSDSTILQSPLQKHNLVMPYLDVYGAVIALVGRSLLPEEERKLQGIPKYKNSEFRKARHLFALNFAKQSILSSNRVYVVEGQFDAIQAHAAGISNVVALGSAAMSAEQFALLLRYTNNITLLLDNDEPGDDGCKRIYQRFGTFAKLRMLKTPQGFKDLDELLVEFPISSQDELEELLVKR